MKLVMVVHKYGVSISDPCCYPLGFMYVSAMFKDVGYDVNVLNYNLWNYDFEKEIKGCDAVCFTGFDEFLPYIKEHATICKNMGIKTILGGALATYKTAEMMDIIDEVFVGEYGATLPIDSIAWPDYEGFGIEEYHKRHDVRYMGVLASRGCPFSCIFCASVCGYRKRSLVCVSEEIDHYKDKYKIEQIIFNDNTLNVHKRRFMKICEMMKPKRLLWSAAIRADNFDDEMAIAAKDSGCNYFVIGIESFRQNRLDMMNKRIKSETIKRTLDILHARHIDYHGNLLLGIDGETTDDILSEVTEMPKGYNVFPVLAQPFSGTKVKSDLSTEQRAALNAIFTQYAVNNGKTVYPLQ